MRGSRFTILLALSLSGILEMRVFEGACNGDLYVNFIEGLAVEMNPYPSPNSCLVINNVGFHKNCEVRDIVEE